MQAISLGLLSNSLMFIYKLRKIQNELKRQMPKKWNCLLKIIRQFLSFGPVIVNTHWHTNLIGWSSNSNDNAAALIQVTSYWPFLKLPTHSNVLTVNLLLCDARKWTRLNNFWIGFVKHLKERWDNFMKLNS